MAKQRLQGKIVVRTERISIIHPTVEPLIRWCPVCRCETSMVVPEEAARYWNVSVRAFYRWMEAGKVHFIEVSGGVLVCPNSIPKPTSGGN